MWVGVCADVCVSVCFVPFDHLDKETKSEGKKKEEKTGTTNQLNREQSYSLLLKRRQRCQSTVIHGCGNVRVRVGMCKSEKSTRKRPGGIQKKKKEPKKPSEDRKEECECMEVRGKGITNTERERHKNNSRGGCTCNSAKKKCADLTKEEAMLSSHQQASYRFVRDTKSLVFFLFFSHSVHTHAVARAFTTKQLTCARACVRVRTSTYFATMHSGQGCRGMQIGFSDFLWFQFCPSQCKQPSTSDSTQREIKTKK
jgi:hypothetical protein